MQLVLKQPQNYYFHLPLSVCIWSHADLTGCISAPQTCRFISTASGNVFFLLCLKAFNVLIKRINTLSSKQYLYHSYKGAVQFIAFNCSHIYIFPEMFLLYSDKSLKRNSHTQKLQHFSLYLELTNSVLSLLLIF